MDIAIRQLRLSVFWSETLPGIFHRDPDTASSYWVSDAHTYQETFDRLQAGSQHVDKSITLPWLTHARQRFWSYYGEVERSQQLNGRQAWRLLVPFRVAGPVNKVSAPDDCDLTQEGFLFPHGIGFAIGIRINGAFSLDGAVERALQVRRDRIFEIECGAQRVDLMRIGENGLGSLRERFIRTNKISSEASLEPFVIVSVMRATGSEVFVPVLEQSDLHRALQGLATLSKTWKDNALNPLADRQLRQEGNKPAIHAVYAMKYGRAIWHPHYFSENSSNKPALNCYHRNLLFASLQAKSLLELINLAQKLRKQGVAPLGSINDFVRRACGTLGRMYGAENTTYRSWTTRRQLVDADAVDMVNAERQLQGMPPLHD